MQPTIPQTPAIKDAAEAFTKAAALLADVLLADVQTRDPQLAAKVAQVVERGEHVVVSLLFTPAPMIELATKDYTGSLKRIGSIQMQARALH